MGKSSGLRHRTGVCLKTYFHRFRLMRIKLNLFTVMLLFVLLFTMLLVAYTFFFYQDSYEYRRNVLFDLKQMQLKQAANIINGSIAKMQQTGEIIKNRFNEIKDTPDKAETFNAYMDFILQMNKDISGIVVQSGKEEVLPFSNPYSPYSFIREANDYYDGFIQLALAGKQDYFVSGRHYGSIDDYLLFAYINSKETTSVFFHQNLDALKEQFEKLDGLSGGTLVLLNSENTVLFFWGEQKDREILERKEIQKALLSAENGRLYHEEEGKYVFYEKNVGFGCNLTYIFQQTANETNSSLFNGFYIANAVFLCMAALFLYNVKRKIYDPIGNIGASIKNIVEGNLEINNVRKKPGLFLSYYDDLSSMTEKLKLLIKNEYAANILRKQAELNAMQSQINPHFLYNTLESIRGQAITEGVTNIERMTKALANLFRYSISKKGNMVTLSEEIKNAENYLTIQQYRFNNKFVVQNSIEPDTLEHRVPKLIIQPLIENAIQHGLETKIGKGTILLKGYKTQSRLIFSIEDDGVGIEENKLKLINEALEKGSEIDRLSEGKTSIGLINVHLRIRMMFGNEYGLKIYSTIGSGTKAEVTLPLQ